MVINLEIKSHLDKLRELKAGSSVSLNGKIYSARDAAHKRLKEYLENDRKIPISLKDSIIYYMGPTPTKEGFPIGSCGPTSSYRMDDLLEITLQLGVIATIGKGERKKEVFDLIKKYKAPYLVTVGGAGAYLANCVISSKIVSFNDLGAEAIVELNVKNFPLITAVDIYGNSIFNKVQINHFLVEKNDI